MSCLYEEDLKFARLRCSVDAVVLNFDIGISNFSIFGTPKVE
jgi:hypothetical protein